MSFFRKLFGPRPGAAPSSKGQSQLSIAATSQARSSPPSSAGTQRDLLREVLAKTLNHHGIPVAWFGCECLLATSRTGTKGVHLRLLVKHWDPRLLMRTVALQNSLIVRLLSFDPMASNWLMGISWQFALPDETPCPPMPHPGSWTADPGRGAREEPRPEVSGAAGDVIAGPVLVASTQADAETLADVRSDLERLFAVRDAELKLLAEQRGGKGADATQPMFLKTQPMDPRTDMQPLE